MKDIIPKIIAFPDLHLSEQEWTDLSCIISSLTTQTKDDLKIYLEKFKFLPADVIKITAVAHAWFDLSQAIFHWSCYINEIWLKITGKSIGADNLVPILVQVLPNNLSELQQNQTKLDLAIKVCTNDEYAYALATFYIAHSAKLESLISNSPSTDDEIIYKVAEEIKKQEKLKENEKQIQELLPLCINYQIEVENRFIYLIKATKFSLYEVIMDTNRTEDQKIIDKILEFLMTNNIELNDEGLTLLKKKYLCLYDLQLTLQNTNSNAIDIMAEFSGKFSHYNDILMQHQYYLGGYTQSTSQFLRLNYLYDYVGWKNSKQRFIEIATLYSQKNEPEIEQVNKKCS
jgi:hypothetical protein